MKCGIAFFAADVVGASVDGEHCKYALHFGRKPEGDFAGAADVTDRNELQRLGRSISASGCDVVSLQHEFGIWGDCHGVNLLPFLEALTLPVVSTLHTTLPPDSQPALATILLRALVARSAIVFVMSPRSRETLRAGLDGLTTDVRVVPHGIPDVPFVPPAQATEPERAPHLVSFGFIVPPKGLHVVLEAIGMLRSRGTRCRYTIAGRPHPRSPDQETYLRTLARLIDERGLNSDVVRIDRFLDRAEQIELIQSADAAVFAYQDAGQASSGAAALALGVGRPIICTPFEFALALSERMDGVQITQGFGAADVAEALQEFFREAPSWAALAGSVHTTTRGWTWRSVAKQYAAAFADAIKQNRLHAAAGNVA